MELTLDQEALKALLQKAGETADVSPKPLAGGGNNRVYELLGCKQRYLLKAYFHHPDDSRDRLKHEFGFLTFLWAQGLRNIPRPIADDAYHHLGLYEFVEGRKLQATEITKERVEEALSFFLAVNKHRAHTEAAKLPPASEACFSFTEHLEKTNKRIERLNNISGTGSVDLAAKKFVEEKLQPFWSNTQQTLQAKSSSAPLPGNCRCLSPSDFGYHNALLRLDGSLCWLDFEYAGWDDPAKLVCDFFSQPVLTVPEEFFESFVEKTCRAFSEDKDLRQRIHQLLLVYRLKWCCIILNEFLPMDSARRKFAGKSGEENERKVAQLQKAESLFQRSKKLPSS